MTTDISAQVLDRPDGRFDYFVSANGNLWAGTVSSVEEARAVCSASVRGILRMRRLEAIKAAVKSEKATTEGNRLTDFRDQF